MEKQAEALVGLADAVVLVWDGTGVIDDVLALAGEKGIPLRVLGAAVERRGGSVEPPGPPG